MCIFLTNKETADEIRDFVIEKAGLNPLAFKTLIIDEIPKNDSGKV